MNSAIKLYQINIILNHIRNQQNITSENIYISCQYCSKNFTTKNTKTIHEKNCYKKEFSMEIKILETDYKNQITILEKKIVCLEYKLETYFI